MPVVRRHPGDHPPRGVCNEFCCVCCRRPHRRPLASPHRQIKRSQFYRLVCVRVSSIHSRVALCTSPRQRSHLLTKAYRCRLSPLGGGTADCALIRFRVHKICKDVGWCVVRFRRRALLPSPSCARLERMRVSRRSAPQSASRGGCSHFAMPIPIPALLAVCGARKARRGALRLRWR